jgi:uncharacterized protein
MEFVWDFRKGMTNRMKHGVSFEEAVSAFHDPLSSTILDEAHSADEPRFLLIGRSWGDRLLVVAHVDLGERIRIISARVATPRERRSYEET